MVTILYPPRANVDSIPEDDQSRGYFFRKIEDMSSSNE